MDQNASLNIYGTDKGSATYLSGNDHEHRSHSTEMFDGECWCQHLALLLVLAANRRDETGAKQEPVCATPIVSFVGLTSLFEK